VDETVYVPAWRQQTWAWVLPPSCCTHLGSEQGIWDVQLEPEPLGDAHASHWLAAGTVITSGGVSAPAVAAQLES